MPERGEAVNCAACRVRLEVVGHLCADCGTYHQDAVPLCETCGSPMTRVCRRCRTLNWMGNSFCISCGTGLDVIETLMGHSTEGSTAVARQQMDEAYKIKRQEEFHSSERMARMAEKEAARQAELQRRMQILAEQKRQMWQRTAVIIVVVILLMIVVALLT